jgi:hypothetical protein
MKVENYVDNKNGEVKVGDIVRVSGGDGEKAGVWIIMSDEKDTYSQSALHLKIAKNSSYNYLLQSSLWPQVKDDICELEVIGNIFNQLNFNQTTMKITNLVKKILDEDTRKLVKANFINGDLALTDEGVQELLGLLFLANKDELVKIADEKIKETN